MDSDHKLLCLLSTLRSMFPYDGRLGAGGIRSGGKAGMSRHRAKLVAQEETEEEKVEKFNKEAEDNIYHFLEYKWKDYKKVRYLPKDMRQRNRLIIFLKEEALEHISTWKKLHKNIEFYWKKIQTDNKKCEADKPAAVKAKANSIRALTALEESLGKTAMSNIRSGKYPESYVNEKIKLDEAIEKVQQCTEDVEKLKWSDPEHLYTPEYIACRQEYNRIKASLDKKADLIFHMRRNRESPEDIKKERIVRTYIQEDYSVLKKIHDDMLLKELKKIFDGTAKRR